MCELKLIKNRDDYRDIHGVADGELDRLGGSGRSDWRRSTSIWTGESWRRRERGVLESPDLFIDFVDFWMMRAPLQIIGNNLFQMPIAFDFATA